MVTILYQCDKCLTVFNDRLKATLCECKVDKLSAAYGKPKEGGKLTLDRLDVDDENSKD